MPIESSLSPDHNLHINTNNYENFDELEDLDFFNDNSSPLRGLSISRRSPSPSTRLSSRNDSLQSKRLSATYS